MSDYLVELLVWLVLTAIYLCLWGAFAWLFHYSFSPEEVYLVTLIAGTWANLNVHKAKGHK